MCNIFVSYAHQDRERVRPYVDFLKSLDFHVFWDGDVDPGSKWRDRVSKQLSSAHIVIVFWSENSVQSEQVKDEADTANDNETLLPVVLALSKNLPLGHLNVQYIQFAAKAPRKENQDRLFKAVIVKARTCLKWVDHVIEAHETQIKQVKKVNQENEYKTQKELAHTREKLTEATNIIRKVIEETDNSSIRLKKTHAELNGYLNGNKDPDK